MGPRQVREEPRIQSEKPHLWLALFVVVICVGISFAIMLITRISIGSLAVILGGSVTLLLGWFAVSLLHRDVELLRQRAGWFPRRRQ